MGERLVVEIKRNDKLIATSYYHWSAYTEPAIYILKSMYDHVLSKAADLTDEQIQLTMIRFAECSTHLGCFKTREERDQTIREHRENSRSKPDAVREMLEDLFYAHGGIDPCDRDAAKRLFPNEEFESENINRNEGLVAITNHSMQDQLKWAERIITVNLDDESVLNGVVDEYGKEEYMAEMEEYDDEYYVDPDELPQSPIDFDKFRLDEVCIVKDVLETTQSDWIRYKDKIYHILQG